MPEIGEIFEAVLVVDKVSLHTHSNGDEISIRGVQLDQESATTLTWLINHTSGTKVRIEITLV